MLVMCLGAQAHAAIVDYELSMRKPFRLTADTGIDSFTHALEAFVSRKRNPYSDSMAIAAMQRIGANLRTACLDRKRVLKGKSVAESVDLGGHRTSQKTKPKRK